MEAMEQSENSPHLSATRVAFVAVVRRHIDLTFFACEGAVTFDHQ